MISDNGLFCVGEYLELETRTVGEKTYHNIAVLVQATIKKFSVKPEDISKITPISLRSRIQIKFTEYQGKGFVNSTMQDIVCLK